jgi:hypothetical protein
MFMEIRLQGNTLLANTVVGVTMRVGLERPLF